MNQAAFSAALLDAKASVPAGVVDPQGRPAGRRFDVYRNNVIVSLSRALASAYPVVERLVGPAFFSAMANVHVRAHPPKSALMIHYGAAFPEWLTTFAPVAQLPYLPDVARLERARRIVYHAADSRPDDGAELAALPPESLPLVRLHFLPALQIVTSAYPILSIWRKNTDDPQLNLPQAGESVLITRPEMELEMRAITPAAAAFITALRDENLGTAAERCADLQGFDLSAALTGILSARLLTKVTIDPA